MEGKAVSFLQYERVYWRRRDLFGSCTEASANGVVPVKLEWPWRQDAPPEQVPVAELVLASVAMGDL